MIVQVEFRESLLSIRDEILDLRRPEAFGGAHIPGAFNIGSGQNLSMWAAWISPYEHPIFMVGDDSTDYEKPAEL